MNYEGKWDVLCTQDSLSNDTWYSKVGGALKSTNRTYMYFTSELLEKIDELELEGECFQL